MHVVLRGNPRDLLWGARPVRGRRSALVAGAPRRRRVPGAGPESDRRHRAARGGRRTGPGSVRGTAAAVVAQLDGDRVGGGQLVGVPVVLAEKSTDLADQGKRTVVRVGGRSTGSRCERLGEQFVKVAVDGGAGDAELGGDLLHGVHPAPVGAGLLVHLLGDLRLARGELGFLPAGAPAGAGGGQAVKGAVVSSSTVAAPAFF